MNLVRHVHRRSSYSDALRYRRPDRFDYSLWSELVGPSFPKLIRKCERFFGFVKIVDGDVVEQLRVLHEPDDLVDVGGIAEMKHFEFRETDESVGHLG